MPAGLQVFSENGYPVYTETGDYCRYINHRVVSTPGQSGSFQVPQFSSLEGRSFALYQVFADNDYIWPSYRWVYLPIPYDNIGYIWPVDETPPTHNYQTVMPWGVGITGFSQCRVSGNTVSYRLTASTKPIKNPRALIITGKF